MQTSFLIRIVQRVAALTALAGGVSTAQAGGVYWAVNVNAPSYGGVVGTTISNTPRGLYGPAPVIVAPPVVVAPQPVYRVGYPVHPRHVHGPRPWWGGKHRYHRGYHDGYREGYRDGRDDDDGWGRGDRYGDDDGWRGRRR